MAVQLGIDAKKSDQVVRGAVVLPNGTGKTKRVAVFAQGAKAEEAKAAGADIVGMDDLAAEIKAGKMDFDVVIASPDTMRVVGTLGQILGPRGLMPNPKVGTVTADVAKAVRDAKAGQVQFRVDKAGIVHATIGRRSFESDKLTGNLRALIDALNKSKPASSKGVYLRKVAVSSTMGVGVRVDTTSLAATGLKLNRPRHACLGVRRQGVGGLRVPQGARRSSKTAGVATAFKADRRLISGQPGPQARAAASQRRWRSRRTGLLVDALPRGALRPGFLKGQVADVRCAPRPAMAARHLM